jgi:hypothetical protein
METMCAAPVDVRCGSVGSALVFADFGFFGRFSGGLEDFGGGEREDVE